MRALTEYKGAAGIGPEVTGRALVASDGFSARYDLDRIQGVFSRPTHKLVGQSYVDRVLVLDIAKGGVATAWMLHEMVKMEKAPLALILNRANPVMAQGAAFGDVPLIDRFDVDITTVLRTGDLLKVDPRTATVTVLERG
jgi:predicted aconitase with swiveling domain